MTSLGNNERIPKAEREKRVVIYKVASIILASDYSTKAFQARGKWHKIFNNIKSRDL